MNYLLTNRTHPSADEIYINLSKTIPTLSKTTVYNTLKLLSEHGAALILSIDENKASFDGETSPHTHFLCKRCGKIYDLPLTASNKKEMGILSGRHVIDEVHHYYRGTCENCLTDINIV